MEDAYSMAIDALGLALEDRIREKDIPTPSTIDSVRMIVMPILFIVNLT